LKPRSALPQIRVRFCRFASANCFIRLRDGVLEVKISDMLEQAPAPVQEALAYILLGKLYRRPVDQAHHFAYRRWLNRADVRKQIHLVRRVRGRKFVSGPVGEHYNLEEIFEELNVRFFGGLMARPQLGWSRRPSKSLLGHYDLAHNAIILSRILDRPSVPRLAVEYVMYHEMLHLRHPVEHRGTRRCVHTPEFRAAEKQFPRLEEAKRMLRHLS
jgi:predicted metal-dependent hydrolase